MEAKIIYRKKKILGKYHGMVIYWKYPRIYMYVDDLSETQKIILENHERIHVAQIEDEIGDNKTLSNRIVGALIWYIKYFYHYRIVLKNYFSKTKSISLREAYFLNPYEIEAYKNETNLEYLKTREKFAFKKYI